MGEVRVGIGFDVHARSAARPLMLGGVMFDAEDGLAGHSDGDAVCHALADALLGAAALGDVGDHFPDTDPSIAGIAGLELLRKVVEKVHLAGLVATSADVTVIAEWPAITPAREEIRRHLSDTLGVPADRMSVKATRPEGLGLTGEGIGCLAIAVLATE
ncbi:MAG: 2-C-methyl-D-erythritol 2,4-cyclodiphosphate synthase [Actinomycetota bacterium]